MDNALIFLGIALLIAVIGGVVVMFLHRDPEASADGVEEFQRIMSALAPDGPHPDPERGPVPERRDGAAPAPAPAPAPGPTGAVTGEGSGDGS